MCVTWTLSDDDWSQNLWWITCITHLLIRSKTFGLYYTVYLTSSPFFTALVLIPATSDPAPGSVTQYACKSNTISLYAWISHTMSMQSNTISKLHIHVGICHRIWLHDAIPILGYHKSCVYNLDDHSHPGVFLCSSDKYNLIYSLAVYLLVGANWHICCK